MFPRAAEDQRREEIVAIAVVTEATGFAQQAVDHVTVVDVVPVFADQAGKRLDQVGLVVHFQVPLVNAHGHPMPNQAGGN